MLAFGIFPFEQLDCGVVIDGTADIPFLIIDFGCQYILGQTRAYALGDLKGGGAGFVLLYGAVGKGDINHLGLQRIVDMPRAYGCPREIASAKVAIKTWSAKHSPVNLT